jgi:tetratricopeptide (TPR) repeat protein
MTGWSIFLKRAGAVSLRLGRGISASILARLLLILAFSASVSATSAAPREATDHLQLADAAIARGDVPAAETWLRRALEANAADAQARRRLAGLLLGVGRLRSLAALLDETPAALLAADAELQGYRVTGLLLGHRLSAARRAADAALAQHPSAARLHTLSASIYRQMDDWPRVVDAARIAVELDSDDADAAYLLIRGLIELDQTIEARAVCNGYLYGERAPPPGHYVVLCAILEPDWVKDWRHHSPLLFTSGESVLALRPLHRFLTGEALPLLQTGHHKDSDSLLGRYLLASRLLDFGRSEEATRLLLALPGPLQAESLISRLLGVALVQSEEWEDGRRFLRRWTQEHPDDEQALTLLRQASIELNDRQRVFGLDRRLKELRSVSVIWRKPLERVLKLPPGTTFAGLARLVDVDRHRRLAGELLQHYPLPSDHAGAVLLAATELGRRTPLLPEVRLYAELRGLEPGRRVDPRVFDALAEGLPEIAPALWMVRAQLARQAGRNRSAAEILGALLIRRPNYRPARLALDAMTGAVMDG